MLVTTEQAAEILCVGRTTVYALMRDGELNPIHIGRSCRLSYAELRRYVGVLENRRWQRRTMEAYTEEPDGQQTNSER